MSFIEKRLAFLIDLLVLSKKKHIETNRVKKSDFTDPAVERKTISKSYGKQNLK